MKDGKRALDEIHDALKNGKVWVPLMCFPCNHISKSPDGSYDISPKESYSSIDVVQLMRQSKEEIDGLQTILQTKMNYPPRSIFRFDEFQGLGDMKKVKNFIFEAGREHGTYLCVRTSRVEKTSPSRIATMLLHCTFEYRDRRGSKDRKKGTFLTGTIQAGNTLLGQARTKSIKPKNKCSECGFSLNIFLSRNDQRWYLSWDNARSNFSPPCHTNHYPIDPSHVKISKRKRFRL